MKNEISSNRPERISHPHQSGYFSTANIVHKRLTTFFWSHSSLIRKLSQPSRIIHHAVIHNMRPNPCTASGGYQKVLTSQWTSFSHDAAQGSKDDLLVPSKRLKALGVAENPFLPGSRQPTAAGLPTMAPKTYGWISLWFVMTAPLMLWDAGYCFMRSVSHLLLMTRLR